MYHPRILLGLLLAGAALAGGAEAATVTLKVSGTYTAGVNATAPASGPVLGYLAFNATPRLQAGYAIYDLVSGDLKFGAGAFDFVAGVGGYGQTSLLVQSTGDNFIDIYDGNDWIDLNFGQMSSDITRPYRFSATPVGVTIVPALNGSAMVTALGGYDPRYGEVLVGEAATAKLTLTTAVPEPATWALATLGFGLTGALLRRRRAQPVAV